MSEIKSPGKKWRTIVTLAISVLGIVFFLLQALTLGVLWLVALFDAQQGIQQSISYGLLAWSAIFSGFLLLPILLLSIYQLRGQPEPKWLDTNQPAILKIVKRLIVLWPWIVLIGWLIAGRPSVAVFLLGPVNLLAAGLPVLWIYTAAQSQLESGSRMRKWRIFGFSLTVMPVVVIIAELIAIFGLVIIGGIYYLLRISADPQLERELMQLANQVMLVGEDMESIILLLEPYILQPSVIFWALAIFGGIIPIIEELIKPLALWGLGGTKITPQEGFVGGLLCGAGFALIENVLYFTTVFTAEDWLFMAIGRAGTGVLHMLASGLVGWGLAKAWRSSKWLFLALITLAAILLHGLWNALALVTGVAQLLLVGPDMSFGEVVLFNSPIVVLLILASLGLFLINRHFRKQDAVSGEY